MLSRMGSSARGFAWSSVGPSGQRGTLWLWPRASASNRFFFRFEDLKIDPTAAYLLAEPSAPEEPRKAAIDRAEAGEQVTTAVAIEILAKAKKKSRRKVKAVPVEKLG